MKSFNTGSDVVYGKFQAGVEKLDPEGDVLNDLDADEILTPEDGYDDDDHVVDDGEVLEGYDEDEEADNDELGVNPQLLRTLDLSSGKDSSEEGNKQIEVIKHR